MGGGGADWNESFEGTVYSPPIKVLQNDYFQAYFSSPGSLVAGSIFGLEILSR